MASPHVAGLALYLISLGNQYDTPSDLYNHIKQLGTKDILKGLPDGTVNLMAFNGANETLV